MSPAHRRPLRAVRLRHGRVRRRAPSGARRPGRTSGRHLRPRRCAATGGPPGPSAPRRAPARQARRQRRAAPRSTRPRRIRRGIDVLRRAARRAVSLSDSCRALDRRAARRSERSSDGADRAEFAAYLGGRTGCLRPACDRLWTASITCSRSDANDASSAASWFGCRLDLDECSTATTRVSSRNRAASASRLAITPASSS